MFSIINTAPKQFTSVLSITIIECIIKPHTSDKAGDRQVLWSSSRSYRLPAHSTLGGQQPLKCRIATADDVITTRPHKGQHRRIITLLTTSQLNMWVSIDVPPQAGCLSVVVLQCDQTVTQSGCAYVFILL